MNRSTLFFAFAFFGCVSGSFSQEKFAIELYGGPSKALLNYEVTPNNYNISPSNQVSWHIGSSFLWGLKNDWQFSAQLEFFKRELGTYAYSRQIDTLQITGYSTAGIPLIALGVRKTWGNLYLQPSLSLMKSPAVLDIYESDNEWDGIPLGVRSMSDIGMGIRLEGGTKIYNRRGNYFFGGLRYQQGLWVMDQMNAPVRYNERIENVLSVKSRGSYVGLFLGYGINGVNMKTTMSRAPKRLYNDNKLLKHELSLEDGWYFMAYGGLRSRENPLSNDYGYSNSSSQFQTVLGYYRNGFSLESGFGNFTYNANYQIDFEGIEAVIMSWEPYNMPVIPLTIKYQIALNDRNSLRIGPSLSTYFMLKDQSNSWFTSSGKGGAIIYGKEFEYTSEAYSDRELTHGRFAFNAGVLVEMSVFNSSLLTFKLSKNFASPDLVKIHANYVVNGTPISVESTGSINGFAIDLGYKIPIKVLNRKLKLAAKTAE
ncbi:hypothetical protein [Algoriphagus terrigena]|uniref:hypothetical protein n=1 Tax=Algoriphagus terrigena TaxID=344884 RepID=UPI00041DE148|nr:hypothetical protein [Algoriphagus terrigena]